MHSQPLLPLSVLPEPLFPDASIPRSLSSVLYSSPQRPEDCLSSELSSRFSQYSALHSSVCSLHLLPGERFLVVCLEVPDSSSSAVKAEVWDLVLRELAFELLDPGPGSVSCTALSAKQLWLFAGLRPGGVTCWNLQPLALRRHGAAPKKLSPCQPRAQCQPVQGLALTSVKNNLALLFHDCSVKILNLLTGNEIFTFNELRATCLDSSHDGKFLAFGAKNGKVNVWEGFEMKYEMQEHRGEVKAVRFGRGKDWLFSAGEDGSVVRWDLATGESEVVRVMERIDYFALTLDDKAFVVADNSFRVFESDIEVKAQPTIAAYSWRKREANTKEEAKRKIKFRAHNDNITGMVVSNDGRYIITGSRDRTLSHFDALRTRAERTYADHPSSVTSAVLFTDLLITSSASSLFLYALSSPTALSTYSSDQGPISALSLTSTLLLCGASEGFSLWLLPVSSVQAPVLGRVAQVRTKARVLSVAAGQSQDFFAIGTSFGGTSLYYLDKHSLSPAIQAFHADGAVADLSAALHEVPFAAGEGRAYGQPNALAISTHCNFYVAACSDKSLRLFRYTRSEVSAAECIVKDLLGTPTCVAISRDGTLVVTGLTDHSVRVFNALTHAEERVFGGHTQKVKGVDIDDNMMMIVSCGDDRTLRVWSMAEKKELALMRGHLDDVSVVRFSHDSHCIVSASKDRTAKIWNVYRRKENTVGLNTNITAMAIGENSGEIVFGYTDHKIKVGDLAGIFKEKYVLKTLVEKHTWGVVFQKENDAITLLVPGKDDEFLLSTSYNRRIQVWKLKAKQWVANIPARDFKVFSMAISDDNKFIAAGYYDGAVKVWKLDSLCLGATASEAEAASLTTFNIATYVDFRNNSQELLLYAGSLELAIYAISDSGSLTESYSACLGKKELSIASISDTKTLIITAFNRKLKVFRIFDAEETAGVAQKYAREEYILGHSSCAVRILRFSSDAQFAVSALIDYAICVWDLNERRIHVTLEGHRNTITGIGMLQGGAYIVSSDQDGVLKVWSLVGHENTRSLAKHPHSLPKPGENRKNTAKTCLPSDFYDSFQHKKIDFYNVIDALISGVYTNLSINSSAIYFSKYLFTVVHVLSYQGRQFDLERLVAAPQFVLRADTFKHSPIYYSIIKKNQICTDLLLDHLTNLSYSKDPARFQQSMFAIHEDFPLIIENASKNLAGFIQNLVITTETQLSSIPVSKTPAFDFNDCCVPIKERFYAATGVATEEAPVVYSYIPFEISGDIGSQSSLELLRVVAGCENRELFSNQYIQMFLQCQWNAVRGTVWFYSALLLLNVIFTVVVLTKNSEYFKLYLWGYLIVNIMLMLWEFVQFCTDIADYVREVWNVLDLLRFASTVVWIQIKFDDYDIGDYEIYLTWTMALLNLLRGVTIFRLFDQTRFYVNLVFTALYNIRMFLVLFIYSTLLFGILFQTATNDELSFRKTWWQTFELNFGGSAEEENKDFYEYLYKLAYFGAMIINVVLILNLLISILGDTYEKFHMEMTINDYLDIANYSLEVQRMMVWKENTKKMYFFVCSDASLLGDDGGWDGSTKLVEKKIEEAATRIKNNREEFKQSMLTKIGSIESKLGELKGEITKNGKVMDDLLLKYRNSNK
jgi:WD40 repeat protein